MTRRLQPPSLPASRIRGHGQLGRRRRCYRVAR
jgi:hypothetical protein